jgi:hypothetical protein
MVLLFIDQLGTKSKWLRGGKEAAEEAFKNFRTFSASALKQIESSEIVTGVVETDSFVLVTRTLEAALAVGKRFYRRSFENVGESRLWLRGAIVPIKKKEEEELRLKKTFAKPYEKVDLFLYNEDLMEVIQIEKSGYKGMRLLVHKEIITAEVRRNMLMKISGRNFIPFAELQSCPYPKRLDKQFQDYLWMAETEKKDIGKLDVQMSKRLRLAALDSEEFLQAAATQVAFHECKAITGGIAKRNLVKRIITERKARRLENTGNDNQDS